MTQSPQMPAGMYFVRTTPEFTHETVPAALLTSHATADGVWGSLVIRSGSATFLFEDRLEVEHVLEAGDRIAIAPQRLHRIVITGPVSFVVEFYRSDVGSGPR